MVMQRTSWADEEEEFVTIEQVHRVNDTCWVRQRRPRRGAMAKCRMEANAATNETVPCRHVPTVAAEMMGAEESLSNQVHTQVDPAIADIKALLDRPDRCKELLGRIEGGEAVEQRQMLLCLQNGLVQLSLSKGGCRIVQKFVEVAAGRDRDLIISKLEDHIVELYESPHGNFVLSKAIEKWPAAKNSFIVTALLGRGITLSKHRFGCRILCRLLEHCPEQQIGLLLDEILLDVDMLARDDFGNYIVQAALEHASQSRQEGMRAQLLPGFASLAMHKDGSRVAERLLDYCSFEGQCVAIQALLQAEGESSLVEVACSRYGSYVIAQLAGLRQVHAEIHEIESILASNLQCLQESQHAERVIVAFGLCLSEQSS